MNLVKIILDLLFNGDVLGKLSSLLGIDNDSTKKAASAAVPALLSGLAGMASSEDGVHKLASTLNNLDTGSTLGTVSSLARMLSGDTSSVVNKGSNLISSLFGDSLVSSIAGSVGRFAGIDNAVSKKLLSLITPSILGLVANQWKDQGGGIGALTSLLAGQQKNIANALPSGFSLASIPGLPSVEGALRAVGQGAREGARAVGEGARAVGAGATHAARRTAGAAEDAGRSLLTWLAPLAALLLAAAALWWFFGRRPVDVARNANDAANAAANTARDAATATADAANRAATNTADAVTALRPTLPDVSVPNISAVTRDISNIFTSATSSLSGIRDAASAQAALPKLNELTANIDAIRAYFDRLPAAAQATLGELISKQYAPIQEQAARILAMPGTSEEVKASLRGITNKLAGLNLAQVTKDAKDIFGTLTSTLEGFKDVAAAEAAVPKLREVSGKINDLQQVHNQMTPGGQTILAKIINTARGPLELLINKVLTALGADAAVVKPVLDEIVTRLTGFAPPRT
jgi:hypothetical protein